MSIYQNEPAHFDALCQRTGLAAPELSASLTMLELAGVLSDTTGDWYTRDESKAEVREVKHGFEAVAR